MTKRGFCCPTYAVSVRKKSMPPWGTLPDQYMSHNRRLLWSFSEEDTMRKCWSYRYSVWLLVSLSLMNHQKLVHVLITSSLMKSSNTFSCCSFPCFIKQLNLTWGHVSPSSTASCISAGGTCWAQVYVTVTTRSSAYMQHETSRVGAVQFWMTKLASFQLLSGFLYTGVSIWQSGCIPPWFHGGWPFYGQYREPAEVKTLGTNCTA